MTTINFEPVDEVSLWSLEPLKISKYDEVVPGYDKTRVTFLLWMGMMLLAYIFAFIIFLCSYTTKVKRFSDLGNSKPNKVALN